MIHLHRRKHWRITGVSIRISRVKPDWYTSTTKSQCVHYIKATSGPNDEWKVEADIPGAFVFQVLQSQALLASQCPNMLPTWNSHGIGIYLANSELGNVHRSRLGAKCQADHWHAPNQCTVVEKVTFQKIPQCKVWHWGEWGQRWSSWWICSNRMRLGVMRVHESQFVGGLSLNDSKAKL